MDEKVKRFELSESDVVAIQTALTLYSQSLRGEPVNLEEDVPDLEHVAELQERLVFEREEVE